MNNDVSLYLGDDVIEDVTDDVTDCNAVSAQQGEGGVTPTYAHSGCCSIRTSDGASGPDSVSVLVSTPGHGCNFTLSSPDTGGEGRECSRQGEGEGGHEVFTCVLEHLEAGTSYLALISSQTDQEEANITLHTRKFTSTRVTRTSLDQ